MGSTAMSFETWIAFVIASAVVVLIPGPNIILTVSHALRSGKRSGLATVPGVSFGALVGMSVSLAGAGAVLAASVTLFSFLKLAGAAYLIWLAYSLWTAPVAQTQVGAKITAQPLKTLFWQSFLVSALNPKGPVFYIAFVPQFIDVAGPAFLQFAILIATFVGVATINTLMWLFFANGLRMYFQKPKAMRMLNRTGAGFLFVAGIFTARTTQAS
jgi:threonine/homoserine/homoserine lactone efflux protein